MTVIALRDNLELKHITLKLEKFGLIRLEKLKMR